MLIFNMFRDHLRAAAKEAGYAVELTDEYLDTLIWIYSSDADKYLEVSPNGFIVGATSDQHLCMPGVKVALEISWWVAPAARGRGEGMELYNGFFKWAKENKCKFILQGTNTKGARKLSEVWIKEI